MRALFTAAVAAFTLTACGAAAARIPTEALGVSARDAFLEARSTARSWSADARLRWVQGEAIRPDGLAVPDQGWWEFHYTAPARTRELVVRVQALDITSEEQPATSPPGFVIGDNALNTGWIDSGAALEAVAAAAGAASTTPASLLLVPTRPPQWVIRLEGGGERWRIHAETGEVLGS